MSEVYNGVKTLAESGKSILAFPDDFVAFAKTFTSSDSFAVTDGARKVVKAGTIIPANDTTAQGVVLQDVDVTRGRNTGAVMFAGSIDTTKLTTQPADAAKKALPRITWFPKITHPAA